MLIPELLVREVAREEDEDANLGETQSRQLVFLNLAKTVEMQETSVRQRVMMRRSSMSESGAKCTEVLRG